MEAIDAMTKGYDACPTAQGTTDQNDVLAAIADLYIEANQLPPAIERLGQLLARTDLTGAQRARALLRRAHAHATAGDIHAARVDARAVLRMRLLPEGYAEEAQRFLE
jgi:lipoprotein NlpI